MDLKPLYDWFVRNAKYLPVDEVISFQKLLEELKNNAKLSEPTEGRSE